MREFIEGMLEWVQSLSDGQIILITICTLLVLAIFVTTISVIVTFICFVWWVNTRNTYIHLLKRVTVGWEELEVCLKQRVALCEEMLSAASAAVGENETLQNIDELRKEAALGTAVEDKIARNKKFTLALRAFYASIPETFPALETDEAFQAKRAEMAALEKEIDVSRQYYNGVVKYYNNRLASFPSKIVGERMGDGFEVQPFFKFH